MDSFRPFTSNKPPYESASHTALHVSLKRQRSDSFQEETTVGSTSDGSLSDSSTASHEKCFVDLPVSYLAVQNLLRSSSPQAIDMQDYLLSIERSSNKTEFRKTIARSHFFKFFTEVEFELLWKEVKSLYSSSRSKLSQLTERQISEFFEERFKEIEGVFLNEWQSTNLKSSTLYIPGHIGDFYLTPVFDNQMNRHKLEDSSFNHTLDFIIKKIRPENWKHLFIAFSAELAYCAPRQVEQIISECTEKGFSDLILLTLSHNPHRSMTMLNALSDYSSRKTEAVFIKNMLGLFVPWLFLLPESTLIAKMTENQPGSLDKKLVSHWVQKQFGRYIKQTAIQKEKLRLQPKIYVDSQPYTQALSFFKNMLSFLQHTITWAGRQEDQLELLEAAVGWLKVNPLLTGGLEPENKALHCVAVLKNQLATQVPLSVIIDLLASFSYFDHRSSFYEITNEVWRSFIKYWHAKRLSTEQIKDQLSAVMLKFRDVSDLHNRPYKDDLEETTFLEMFLKTFAPHAEIFELPEYQLLFQHFLKNNFQLLHDSNFENSKLSYKTLEMFLNFLAQAYEYAPVEQKQNYMNYLMSQSFMSQHCGLSAVYMMLIRTMSQSTGPLSSSFCREFLETMVQQPSLFSRVPLDTIVDFLKKYEAYIQKTGMTSAEAHETVMNIAEQIIAKNDNPLLSDSLKSIYDLTEVSAPLIFAGPRSFSPLNIQVLPISYGPAQQKRVIYHFNESAFVKNK